MTKRFSEQRKILGGVRGQETWAYEDRANKNELREKYVTKQGEFRVNYCIFWCNILRNEPIQFNTKSDNIAFLCA